MTWASKQRKRNGPDHNDVDQEVGLNEVTSRTTDSNHGDPPSQEVIVMLYSPNFYSQILRPEIAALVSLICGLDALFRRSFLKMELVPDRANLSPCPAPLG